MTPHCIVHGLVSDFLFPDLDFPLQFAVSEVLQMCSGWNDFMRLLLINILLQLLVLDRTTFLC